MPLSKSRNMRLPVMWMVEGVGDFMEGGRERARKEEEEEEEI